MGSTLGSFNQWVSSIEMGFNFAMLQNPLQTLQKLKCLILCF